jgi:hypothetical protein
VVFWSLIAPPLRHQRLSQVLRQRDRPRPRQNFAGLGVDSLETCYFGQPPNDHIAVAGIELDAVSTPAGALGRDQRGAGSRKDIEHDAFAPRAVENRVGDECDWLDRRVHGQVLIAATTEPVDTGVGPDIRPVPAMLAQLDVVDVPALARLEHEHELVLRAIERAHAAIRLGPDAQILEAPSNRPD